MAFLVKNAEDGSSTILLQDGSGDLVATFVGAVKECLSGKPRKVILDLCADATAEGKIKVPLEKLKQVLAPRNVPLEILISADALDLPEEKPQVSETQPAPGSEPKQTPPASDVELDAQQETKATDNTPPPDFKKLLENTDEDVDLPEFEQIGGWFDRVRGWLTAEIRREVDLKEEFDVLNGRLTFLRKHNPIDPKAKGEFDKLQQEETQLSQLRMEVPGLMRAAQEATDKAVEAEQKRDDFVKRYEADLKKKTGVLVKELTGIKKTIEKEQKDFEDRVKAAQAKAAAEKAAKEKEQAEQAEGGSGEVEGEKPET